MDPDKADEVPHKVMVLCPSAFGQILKGLSFSIVIIDQFNLQDIGLLQGWWRTLMKWFLPWVIGQGPLDRSVA